MLSGAETREPGLDLDLHLPVTLLARYLFFLSRRPISRSNPHFLKRRLAGLQSLIPLLEGRHPALEPILQDLLQVTPGSFARQVTGLLRQLRPLTPSLLPPDLIVSRRPPPEDFLQGVEELEILFAPGIGIGDEILCFPLPSWLEARLPGVRITVFSAYPEIWSRVPAVDRRVGYRDYSDLVGAIRRAGDDGEGPDLTMMVDFEKPALLGAVAGEPRVRRYVELSLGARKIACYDGAARRVHDSISIAPYLGNYYDTLRHFGTWLSAPADGSTRTVVRRGETEAADDTTRILASPFTSKLDPKESFWSELLAGLLLSNGPGSTELLFDPGPNLSTERFARSLARSTRARGAASQAPAACRVIQQPGRRTLPLSGVFDALDQAEVVVCSDSFAAHAAPLFGCLTLVVAQPGLEDWRVPSPRSFYFDSRRPAAVLASAMAGLITAAAQRQVVWWPPGSKRLLAATDDFESCLRGASPPTAAELAAGYTELAHALHGVLGTFDQWPARFVGLLDDRPYRQLLPALPGPRELGEPEELALHLDNHYRNWRNSNLYKYLALGAPDRNPS